MKELRGCARDGLSFMEILLDETLCQGTIAVPREMVRKAGGINKKLHAKQKYELLLRIAQESPIVLEERTEGEPEPEDEVVLLEDDEAGLLEEYGWQTDCYVIGKYSVPLRENGYFDAAVMGVLEEAASCNRYEKTVQFMERMIGHAAQYYQIDDVTRPILIYKGDPVCYNVLTIFAEQLGGALERQGQLVMYFDTEEEDAQNLVRFMGNHFKAIIGVQSCCFSIKMSDEIHYLHEYIYGPKYNFFFDHPIWGKPHLEHNVPDFHVLAHDSTYVSFIKKYYKKDAILFPPAGMQLEEPMHEERVYDVTFIGTYGNYWEQLMWIRGQERQIRFLANRFLLIMKQNPNLTAEEAFAKALEHYHIKVTEEEFLEDMYLVRRVIFCVMHYYRDRVMRAILDSGIRVDVFGDSWLDCPLCKYPNLICHPAVTIEENMLLWEQSKISLNVMSWHKGGFTERMAGIMLAGAVLATDDTFYLKGRYDENDMIIFRLEQLEELPRQIKRLLADDARRARVAESGRKKTEAEHTWDRRAEQFLALLP